MVDQVDATKDYESSGDPKCARIAAEDDALIRLRAHIYVLLNRDDNSVLDVVHTRSLDNRACGLVFLRQIACSPIAHNRFPLLLSVGVAEFELCVTHTFMTPSLGLSNLLFFSILFFRLLSSLFFLTRSADGSCSSKSHYFSIFLIF